MDHPLAKELKDAGFPQKRASFRFGVAGKGESVFIPTLEELIEACGNNFDTLTRVYAERTYIAVNFGGTLQGVGSNPTDAVACLWLASKNLRLHIPLRSAPLFTSSNNRFRSGPCRGMLAFAAENG